MTLGQIFQSTSAWQKLSAINMKAALAYKILKYVKAVGEELAIVEKQRVSLVHEAAGTKPGEDVSLEPGTSEFQEYAEKFGAVLATESDLEPIGLVLAQIVDAVDEKDESLSVKDLAMLEPFFLDLAVGDVCDGGNQRFVDAEKACEVA